MDIFKAPRYGGNIPTYVQWITLTDLEKATIQITEFRKTTKLAWGNDMLSLSGDKESTKF
jgi:hypothetical protein